MHQFLLDECGICGGDNSQCEEIYGTYNISREKGLYSKVVRIPKGSSNIQIRQTGSPSTNNDENYLGSYYTLLCLVAVVIYYFSTALVDGETGEYILNGKHVVSTFAKDVFFGGLTIKYSGSEDIVETLTTVRNHKLTKDLILEVLSVGTARPPDITYRYTISKDVAPK